MRPPRLSQRQMSVEAAMDVSMGLGDITYKYPRIGGYRSPFVFYDLDGDGTDEAIVFYAYNSSPEDIRAKILKENTDGSWSVIFDLSGIGGQVDFIEFPHILSQDQPSMLVGWQDARGATSFGVYTLTGGVLRTEHESSYQLLDISSYFEDKLSQIAFIRQDFSGHYNLNFWGRAADGRFAEIDSIYLSAMTDEVLSIKNGLLTGTGRGVFADIRIRETSHVATEVYEVTRTSLRPVISERAPPLFEETFRDSDNPSRGPDENGVVEIPTFVELPGYVAEHELAAPPLTVFLRPARTLTTDEEGITEQTWELRPSRSAVINSDDGYLIYFPDSWVGNVTVLRRPESNEWQFYKIDPATDMPTTELLRIRVSSVRDYQDRFISNYIMLREKGLFKYHAFIPQTTGEPLAITEVRLAAMFELL
jgi:hypothetical protein